MILEISICLCVFETSIEYNTASISPVSGFFNIFMNARTHIVFPFSSLRRYSTCVLFVPFSNASSKDLRSKTVLKSFRPVSSTISASARSYNSSALLLDILLIMWLEVPITTWLVFFVRLRENVESASGLAEIREWIVLWNLERSITCSVTSALSPYATVGFPFSVSCIV